MEPGVIVYPEDLVVSSSPINNYASFWRRLGAFFLDYILLAIPLSITISTFGFNKEEDLRPVIIALVLGWIYFTLMESSIYQASLGKIAVGIKVTDMSGNKISWGRANARYWSKIISALITFFGFIMAAFTEKSQGLHDIIAKTLVLKK